MVKAKRPIANPNATLFNQSCSLVIYRENVIASMAHKKTEVDKVESMFKAVDMITDTKKRVKLIVGANKKILLDKIALMIKIIIASPKIVMLT